MEERRVLAAPPHRGATPRTVAGLPGLLLDWWVCGPFGPPDSDAHPSTEARPRSAEVGADHGAREAARVARLRAALEHDWLAATGGEACAHLALPPQGVPAADAAATVASAWQHMSAAEGYSLDLVLGLAGQGGTETSAARHRTEAATERAGRGLADGTIAYAACLVRAERRRQAALRLSGYGGYRVWLNGRAVASRDWQPNGTFDVDDNLHPVTLQVGDNILLVKLLLGYLGRRFGAQLTTVADASPGGVLDVGLSPGPATLPDGPELLTPRPSAYFNARFAAPPRYRFRARSKAQEQRWRRQWRRRLLDLLGLPADFPAAVRPPRAELVSVEQGAGFVRQKLVLHPADGELAVPAYLLLPAGSSGRAVERGPALLCPHGHGPGARPVVGVTQPPAAPPLPTGATSFAWLASMEAMERLIAELNYDYAVQLVRRGYVTLTPEFFGFGERADRPLGRRHPCDNHFFQAMLLGETLIGRAVREMALCLDYLGTLPQVDPERLGCVGLSQGGRTTMYLAALDERVRVAVVSGALNSFAERLTSWAGCGSQFPPGLLRYGDTAEILGLIAPRPLLFELGTNDGTSPELYAAAVYHQVERVYQTLGVPERLAIDIFHTGHRFSGRRAFPWLERWLGPADNGGPAEMGVKEGAEA